MLASTVSTAALTLLGCASLARATHYPGEHLCLSDSLDCAAALG